MADEWNTRSPLDELPRWFQPPLHERIQAYVDEVNPETPGGRGPWMADLRVSTPGEAGDFWAGTITDFELTVDGDRDHREDLTDATRYYLADHGVDVDVDEPDWEAMAEDLERNGPDSPFPDDLTPHQSIYPGEARTLAEGEALVGTHPDHETLEELPGPCIMCGKDEVYTTVQRNPDGEIEETELKCDECGWRVSGGPLRLDEKERLNPYGDHVDWNQA